MHMVARWRPVRKLVRRLHLYCHSGYDSSPCRASPSLLRRSSPRSAAWSPSCMTSDQATLQFRTDPTEILRKAESQRALRADGGRRDLELPAVPAERLPGLRGPDHCTVEVDTATAFSWRSILWSARHTVSATIVACWLLDYWEEARPAASSKVPLSGTSRSRVVFDRARRPVTALRRPCSRSMTVQFVKADWRAGAVSSSMPPQSSAPELSPAQPRQREPRLPRQLGPWQQQ